VCLSLLDLCFPPTVFHYCSSPTRRAPYDRFFPCERISPHGLSIVVGVSCDLAVGHAEFLAILHQRFAVPACSVHDAVRVCALTTSEVWSSQRPVRLWGLPLATAHAPARADEHAICKARSLQTCTLELTDFVAGSNGLRVLLSGHLFGCLEDSIELSCSQHHNRGHVVSSLMRHPRGHPSRGAAGGRGIQAPRQRAQHEPIISSAASMTSPVRAGSTLGLFAIMFACPTPGGASGLVSYARTRRARRC
jgi:hypothetical protein